MGAFADMPIWAQALSIFALRVTDVSMGTLRTISVVQGKMKLSVFLGFFEVLVWICGVSQVMAGLTKYPVLALAYAGGFAVGNGVGILLERAVALGSVALTIISPSRGRDIAEKLRSDGQPLTTLAGEGRDGPVTMIYTTVSRRSMRRLLESARSIDPRLFYSVEPLREWRLDMTGRPLPHATGWRTWLKMK